MLDGWPCHHPLWNKAKHWGNLKKVKGKSRSYALSTNRLNLFEEGFANFDSSSSPVGTLFRNLGLGARSCTHLQSSLHAPRSSFLISAHSPSKASSFKYFLVKGLLLFCFSDNTLGNNYLTDYRYPRASTIVTQVSSLFTSSIHMQSFEFCNCHGMANEGVVHPMCRNRLFEFQNTFCCCQTFIDNSTW